MPLRVNCLLKVLNLLADLLELGFAEDDVLRDRGVVRFRAERVQLAKHLLGDELERASDRLILSQLIGELCEVTFEPGQLFRNVGAVGENCELLE
ncbi:MAG: hypothetical protein WKF47_06640 [Geodermatophilaceae bacterium]